MTLLPYNLKTTIFFFENHNFFLKTTTFFLKTTKNKLKCIVLILFHFHENENLGETKNMDVSDNDLLGDN